MKKQEDIKTPELKTINQALQQLDKKNFCENEEGIVAIIRTEQNTKTFAILNLKLKDQLMLLFLLKKITAEIEQNLNEQVKQNTEEHEKVKP